MTGLYPEIEPYEHGMLEVSDGNLVYWETCGNPRGKAAVVLHGGPGSGCLGWHRRLFDPQAYRVVMFDQRGCGRSTPHASAPDARLESNNTASLMADIELLRKHLDIDHWLVLGGSWGSTLGLAYTQSSPDRVSEIILYGVTTGRRKEFDWLFRGGLAVFFPEQWDQLIDALPAQDRDGDVVEAYHRLLNDPDPDVRIRATYAWCMWESATPAWPPSSGLAGRFNEPDFALAFARLVTHYVRHNAWLEDEGLMPHIDLLAEIPAVLINGRFDFQAPVANAWELHRVWPSSELVIVDDAGHAASSPGITRELIRATDRFAAP